MRRILLMSLAVASAVSLGTAGGAQAQSPAGEADGVIVRFKAGADAAERREARRDAGAELERSLPLPGTQLLALDEGASVSVAVAALDADPQVLYAEPNARRTAGAAVDDPYFGLLWGLSNTGQLVRQRAGTPGADIKAPAAWDVTTGSPAAPVAVVDSGVDLTHPDLQEQAWRNPEEVAGNGLDDDGNGFADDVHGWDWVDDDADPADANGHGTHVAGTVAARGDDATGVVGVAPAASVMALRVLDENGTGTVADAISAYTYAARAGVRVLNASLGGETFSRAERDAIAAAPGLLFVVAAGNGGEDGVGDDNDAGGEYPCAYDLPTVVCVAATDQDDALADFSNRGARTVDLAAPGVSILSSLPGGYAFASGTSMATPHVAGVAALLAARDPDAGPAALERALAAVEPLPGLDGRTVSGGRLDAVRALAALEDPDPPTEEPPPPPPDDPPAPAEPPAPAPAPADGAPPPASPVPPAPTPLAPRDDDAPLASLTTALRPRLAGVRRSGLRARVGCSERCTLSARLTLSAAAARRAGLGGRRPSLAVLGRGSGRVAGPGRGAVVVRLTAAARRLRPARSLRATLTVRVADAAGNARNLRTAVLLRR